MDNFLVNELLGLFLANDGYIVVHKSIIKLFGNSAANFLAELISEYNYYKKQDKLIKKDEKEWFFSSIKNIEENIGFTRRQQESLIKYLTNFIDYKGNSIDIIETKQMGMPQQRFFSINFDGIYYLLKNNPELINRNYKNKKKINKNIEDVKNNTQNVDFSRMYKKDIQECTKRTFKNAQKVHSRMHKMDIHNNNNITKINNTNNLSYLPTLPGSEKIDETEERNNNFCKFEKANQEIIKFNNNIDYDALLQEYNGNNDKSLGTVFNLLYDQAISIINTDKEYYVISGEKVLTDELIKCILAFDKKDFIEIVNNLYKQKNSTKNIRNYMIATIYNHSRYKKFYNLKASSREEYNKWFTENILKINDNQVA